MTAAPASGAQTQGSRAALTAEVPIRSQPGRHVASSPQPLPEGSVPQPASARASNGRNLFVA
jgi:hypothetical protein